MKSNATSILPAQCRMARAGLNWSLQTLATNSGLGVNTVSRFENSDVDAGAETLARLISTFRTEGVELLPADGEGGPGVRLGATRPHVVRKPIWNPFSQLVFMISYREKRARVFVAQEILEDLDRGDWDWNETRALQSYERNRGVLLDAAARALDAGALTPDGRIYLKHEHLVPGSV